MPLQPLNSRPTRGSSPIINLVAKIHTIQKKWIQNEVMIFFAIFAMTVDLKTSNITLR